MKGLTLWKLQRLSALYLLVYYVYIATMIYVHSPIMTYELWSSFMFSTHMAVATIAAILLLSMHAWIGVRGIVTDYIKCTSVRFVFLGFYALMLLLSTTYCILVFWS